jgi:hypothetical protein
MKYMRIFLATSASRGHPTFHAFSQTLFQYWNLSPHNKPLVYGFYKIPSLNDFNMEALGDIVITNSLCWKRRQRYLASHIIAISQLSCMRFGKQVLYDMGYISCWMIVAQHHQIMQKCNGKCHVINGKKTCTCGKNDEDIENSIITMKFRKMFRKTDAYINKCW